MPATKQLNAITGPHHCASMGNHLVKHIFGTLYQQVKQGNDHLSIEYLQDIEKAYHSGQEQMSQLYANTYNFCMEATSNKSSLNFDPAKLFPFCLDHFCRTILSEVCPDQAGLGHEKWLGLVSRHIAKYIRSRVSTPVDNILNELYLAASDRKGCVLTAFDLMSDKRIRRTVEKVLVSFHKIRKDDAGVQIELTRQINNQVKTSFQGLQLTRLSITVEQVDSILIALEEKPFESLVSLEQADLIAVEPKTQPQAAIPVDARCRELINLLVKAEQESIGMELENVQKCLNLAIHLVKLKNSAKQIES